MKTKVLCAFALTAITLASCTKNSSSGGTVTYRSNAVTPSYSIARTQGTVTWTAGYVNVSEIEFEAEGSSGHVKFESEAHQKIDLFAAVATLGNITIPAGTYHEVKFEFELDSTNSAGAFQLQGTVNGTPVVLQITGPYEMSAEMTNVTIAADGSYTAIETMDLSKLTAGITSTDFSNATKDASGKIIISASSNTNLYNTIIANLHQCEILDFK